MFFTFSCEDNDSAESPQIASNETVEVFLVNKLDEVEDFVWI